jgi:hypothetical protein
LAAGILLALASVFSPTLEGLNRPGQNALGAFFLCLGLWITGALPLAVTGLLAIALLPLLGVMPPTEAFALFGNSAVFFILGAFILSAALMRTGLSKRLALLLLIPFGKSPTSLRNGILFTSAFLAFWMPEHAVAAMFFSIVLEVAMEEYRTRIQERLDDPKAIAQERSVKCFADILQGDTLKAVWRWVHKHHAELIVVLRPEIIDPERDKFVQLAVLLERRTSATVYRV